MNITKLLSEIKGIKANNNKIKTPKNIFKNIKINKFNLENCL